MSKVQVPNVVAIRAIADFTSNVTIVNQCTNTIFPSFSVNDPTTATNYAALVTAFNTGADGVTAALTAIKSLVPPPATSGTTS